MSKVFISYSHDSREHADRVLDFCNRLVEDGIDCILDQYEDSPAEGWPRWMDKHIRDADFVVMICTETYYKRVMGEEEKGKGLGVKWEGNLVYQHIYNADTTNTRFLPVLFEDGKVENIPTPLQGATHYRVDSEEGYEQLYRRLTNQPRTKRPKLGKLQKLPSRQRKQDFFGRGREEQKDPSQKKYGLPLFCAATLLAPVLGVFFSIVLNNILEAKAELIATVNCESWKAPRCVKAALETADEPENTVIGGKGPKDALSINSMYDITIQSAGDELCEDVEIAIPDAIFIEVKGEDKQRERDGKWIYLGDLPSPKAFDVKAWSKSQASRQCAKSVMVCLNSGKKLYLRTPVCDLAMYVNSLVEGRWRTQFLISSALLLVFACGIIVLFRLRKKSLSQQQISGK